MVEAVGTAPWEWTLLPQMGNMEILIVFISIIMMYFLQKQVTKYHVMHLN